MTDLRIPADWLPTILRIVPGTARIGAQLTISNSAGSTSIYNLTADRCDALAEMLKQEADRMRRIAAEDQRILDAIAADEIGDAP